MTCRTCEAAGFDHDEIRARCLADPFWTGKILCKFKEFEENFHGVLTRWFLERYNAGSRRFLIIIPRMHFKTSLFGPSFVLWSILKDREKRVLYTMASCEGAEERLGVVKAILNNPDKREPFAHFFPEHLCDPSSVPKWRNNAIELPRKGTYVDPTIKAVGINSSVTGGHYTDQIFDDLIDETNSDSLPAQERAIRYLKRAGPLFSDLRSDLRIIIGTRWPGPFYEWLIDGAIAAEYERVEFGAEIDHRFRSFMSMMNVEVPGRDGEPVFPQRFSPDALKAQRVECGDYDYSHQFLNIAVDESVRRFRQEDFRFYNLDPSGTGIIREGPHRVPFSELFITLTVDPSSGEGGATDQSAITVCGLDKKTGDIYVLYAWDDRVLPYDLIDKIIDVAKEWNPKIVAIEEVSMQKTLKHFLAQRMQERKTWFSIRPVRPGNKSKGSRIIDALQPYVRNNQLYVLRSMDRLVNEAVNLQVIGGKVHGRSPNLIDSLAYHAEFWRGIQYNKAEEEDIEFVDASEDKETPRYGLCCAT